MTYRRDRTMSKTTGATCGAGTSYHSRAHKFIPGFQCGSCCTSVLCNVIQIIVCPFVRVLFAIVLSVLLRFTASDYPFGILAIVLSVLIRFTASDYPFGILAIVLSVLLRFTASDYPFGILAVVLSVLQFTASDYPFGILWPLCCLSFGLRF